MKKPECFVTSVLGVGPFCVEFPDGEIITTLSADRQVAIAESGIYAPLRAKVREYFEAKEAIWTWAHRTGPRETRDELTARLQAAEDALREAVK